MIHPLSNVQSTDIGEGTTIWQYCVVLQRAHIGCNCNINCGVFIENDVIVGDNVTVKCGVQLWDGLRVGNSVFIGPNVTFTNDLHPRATNGGGQLQTDADWACIPTLVKRRASIGSGATLLCGITIGEDAMIGAGSVVTKDVPAGAVVAGNPARVIKPSR